MERCWKNQGNPKGTLHEKFTVRLGGGGGVLKIIQCASAIDSVLHLEQYDLQYQYLFSILHTCLLLSR